MMEPSAPTWSAFAGERHLASGHPREVALAAKRAADAGEQGAILVFDDRTAERVELDLRGSEAELAARYADMADEAAAPLPRRPGRPRLGVVAREVTLLPRHWDWLNRQSGGASVALRRLVDEARRSGEGRDRQREAQERAYRVMAALAGNAAGFEEAARALFAAEAARFAGLTESWPEGPRDYVRRLAAAAFE